MVTKANVNYVDISGLGIYFQIKDNDELIGTVQATHTKLWWYPKGNSTHKSTISWKEIAEILDDRKDENNQ